MTHIKCVISVIFLQRNPVFVVLTHEEVMTVKKVLLLLLVVGLMAGSICAKSSAALRKELDALKAQAEALHEQGVALEEELNQNAAETKSVVDRKYDIDRKIRQTELEMENVTGQVLQYSLLIAEKQKDLEAAELEYETQFQKYKTRLRAMEERGKISYWEVLFQSKNFSDLLDRIHMIREIARADQQMLETLQETSNLVRWERELLQIDRQAQEQIQEKLVALEQELEQERLAADACLKELAAEMDSLSEVYAEIAEQEAAMQKELMEAQAAYDRALSEEEAARLAQLNKENAAGGSVTNGSGSGFVRPVSGGSVTDAYGWRIHPTEKIRKFHTGVDLAVPMNTPIVAIAAGTVSECGNNKWYGNHVTLSHGGGYGSFYGHMTNYVVSVGDTVTQGQVIGYVGSTGISTGPHLHFEIYINGATVNPMEYVS